MAKRTKTFPTLLRWSDYVSASDVQDPLGLGLRGSTRLASRLLYCITSITPRARYFSFIPWCVLDYRKREKKQPYALGLKDAITMREKGFTLACIAHHEGKACSGGALVGTREASRWFAKGLDEADFKKVNLAKIPALNAYLNSVVNLGCFVTEEDMPDIEEAEESQFTFDDIELSPLGLDLAQRYDSLVGKLRAVRHVSSSQRKCSVKSLAEWGKRGGLCEIADVDTSDRHLLRNIFFALIDLKGDSHRVRKQSLLLILELCGQLSACSRMLEEWEFASAVYFGEVVFDDARLKIDWPHPLIDIATRWRMFYFHHFMSVALEGLFSWLLSQLADKGLTGATVESLVAGLESSAVTKDLSRLLDRELALPFGRQSPADFFGRFGLTPSVLNAKLSRNFDGLLGAKGTIAEDRLEMVIREGKFLYSPTGLAVPIILLALTLARYTQWETTNYGNWLASIADNPDLDLIPPILTKGLTRRFGNWWQCRWKELAIYVLSRYVIQQHQSMSYEKSTTGDRCLLQVDSQKVISTASYEQIGMGNPRFQSAVQILKDLALLKETEDGITIVTEEGKQLLRRELAMEASK